MLFRSPPSPRPESNPARIEIAAGSTCPNIGRSRAGLVIRTPSISPDYVERDTYLVLDDFGGQLGCAWHEADVENTDRATSARGRRTEGMTLGVPIMYGTTKVGQRNGGGNVCCPLRVGFDS